MTALSKLQLKQLWKAYFQPTSADFSNLIDSWADYNFTATGTSAVARPVISKLGDIVSVKDFGAVGDGVTDDTGAVQAAITRALSLTPSPSVYFPAGYYKITSALPSLTKPITLYGDGPRSSQIQMYGASTLINVVGSGSRAADVVFSDLAINGNWMTAGFAVVVDFAQGVKFLNVHILNPYNGVSLRQCGNTDFAEVLMDYVRGDYGVYGYGESVSRNGENDQIDVVTFTNVIIQGNYTPGGAAPAAKLIVLDGRCHTIQVNGLRLLSARHALVTLNTPGLPTNLVPRFITGTSLEAEAHYAECFDLQATADFFIVNFFCAGSHTADGVKLGSQVNNFCIDQGLVASNSLHGININASGRVSISGVTVYNNSLVGAGLKDGIYVSGSGVVDIKGGLCGKAMWLPSYTEPQKFGIELDSGFNGTITVQNVDLRNNNVGAFYDNNGSAAGSVVAGCPGYNPRGATLQTVGASPYIYTSGLTQESVSIYGGTGVTSEVDGVFVGNQSPCSFTLPPRKTVIVTYVSAPFMAILKA